MDFPWLQSSRPHDDGEARRERVVREEIAHRAATLYRLGFSVEAASERIAKRIAWEFDPGAKANGHHRRPAALTDQAIAKIVADTYARRPA